MRIVLCRGTGLVSGLIRFQTRSQYSHAGLLFRDDIFIHATWPQVTKTLGVPRDYDYDLFSLTATKDEESRMREFAEDQLGKPYDITMVLRFVTRQQETRKSKGAWFCSELVFAACRAGGIELLKNIEPWAVSPELIALSPRLTRINGGAFDEKAARKAFDNERTQAAVITGAA